jgi:Ca2+-binding EF-hand superfamily protein
MSKKKPKITSEDITRVINPATDTLKIDLELAKATESLKKLDKNRDGQLSAEEFRPAPGGGMGRPPQ